VILLTTNSTRLKALPDEQLPAGTRKFSSKMPSFLPMKVGFVRKSKPSVEVVYWTVQGAEENHFPFNMAALHLKQKQASGCVSKTSDLL
jgi:hypothetical protein